MAKLFKTMQYAALGCLLLGLAACGPGSGGQSAYGGGPGGMQPTPNAGLQSGYGGNPIMPPPYGSQQPGYGEPAYGGQYARPEMGHEPAPRRFTVEHPFQGAAAVGQYRCDASGRPATPGTGWCSPQ